MAGAKKSKNSRTVAPSNQKTATAGDTKLIVPCNAGKHAYLRNVEKNTNPHLPTDSDAFADLVRANSAAGYGAKLRSEIEGLAAEYPAHAWGQVLARLDAADAFAG